MRHVLALLATATALATPALAQPLRSGPAAYGNWQADAPGVTRLIRPQDMPAPHATPAATARSTVVPRPANAMPKVPPGFAIALVAAKLGVAFMPRMIALQWPNPATRCIPIKAPSIYWHMALIWRRDGFLPPAAKAWLAMVGLEA